MQEQIHKPLTFEEIVPTWTRLLEENGGWSMEMVKRMFEATDGEIISLDHINSCLVGEAHGNQPTHLFFYFST